ncbi:cytochrome P450 [Streptacidiphilus jiangxiensis]|uniref:Cytochrome P450 n=1 Tax=Streptacidiphilus jiangxiensis TaxID=235985 RepID=A0A1H7IBX8_STRJI|nr:cytochrome P450 [Streptacidiphilus jiangxiensis]SEK59030.1 Cytochrome P450 [Streptacidiphilus jiangxiensis]
MTTEQMTEPEAEAGTGAEPIPYPFPRPDALTPCPHYARLRETQPVARVRMPSGDSAHLVTTYDEVRAVLADPRFSRAATLAEGAPRLAAAPQRFPSLPNLDGAEHARVRALVSREFTARRVAALRPRIQQLTDALLDEMAARGEADGRTTDLVQALAFPLPVRVICELLGVPQADQERFTAWSGAFVATTGSTAEEMLGAIAALRDYFASLYAEKRRNPGEDLLSALVSVRDSDQERLSEQELLFLGVSLLVAGHETTVNQIGNSVLALLAEPGQADRFRADPDGVPAAVEELLRLHLPGDETLLRIAVEDVDLGGTLIRAGEAVLPSLGSGNRDGARFAQPERLELDRPLNAHLSFGHGIHYCLGSGLARAELQIALWTLFERFPTLRLAVPAEQVPRTSGRLITGVASLPVSW